MINTRKITVFFISLTIFIAPIFTFGEVMAIFQGITTNKTDVVTPLWIKVFKDVLMILIFLLSAKLLLRRTSIGNIEAISLGIFLLIIPSIFYMFMVEKILFLSGIRWLLPLMLGITLISLLQNTKLESFLLPIKAVLLIHLSFQIVQMFMLKFYSGDTALEISLRNSGIFIAPNSAAFFSVSVFLFFLFCENITSMWKLLAFFSVLLSGSSTGQIILVLIVFLNYFRYFRPLYPIFLIPVAFTGISMIEYIRPNVIQESLMIRIYIFIDNIFNSELFISNFGASTNTAFNFSYLLHESEFSLIGADSFWGGVPINLGFILFILFFTLFIALMLKYYHSRDFNAFLLVLSVFLFGFTSSITEVFPANLIIAILFAKLFSGERVEITTSN